MWIKLFTLFGYLGHNFFCRSSDHDKADDVKDDGNEEDGDEKVLLIFFPIFTFQTFLPVHLVDFSRRLS